MKKFDLIFGVSDLAISRKMAIYLSEFIYQNVLLKKKIVVDSKYCLLLGFSFFLPSEYGPPGVYVYKPSFVGNDRTYTIQIPLKQILDSSNQPLELIRLLFAGLSLFFTQTYNKVTTTI